MFKRILFSATCVVALAVVEIVLSQPAQAQWWGQPTVVYRAPRTYVVSPAPVRRVYVAPQPVLWQAQPTVVYRPRPILRPRQWAVVR